MSDRLSEDPFLTVAEIAERLRVNPQTVRNWIDRGQLRALRVGRRVRIRQSDFERFLAAGATGRPGGSVGGFGGGAVPAGESPTAAPLLLAAQSSFLDAVCELLRLLGTERSGELVSALRAVARRASRWAEVLESEMTA